MVKFESPLRYPGGKTQLTKFVANTIELNGIKDGIYCEPFSGGFGVGLNLLYSKSVNLLIINDYDIGIYSIWNAILTEPHKLIDLILTTPVTIEEWNNQKEAYIKLIA